MVDFPDSKIFSAKYDSEFLLYLTMSSGVIFELSDKDSIAFVLNSDFDCFVKEFDQSRTNVRSVSKFSVLLFE